MIFFFQHFICKKPVRLFFLLSNNFANSERIPIKIMREGPKSQKNHCDRKKNKTVSIRHLRFVFKFETQAFIKSRSFLIKIVSKIDSSEMTAGRAKTVE